MRRITRHNGSKMHVLFIFLCTFLQTLTIGFSQVLSAEIKDFMKEKCADSAKVFDPLPLRLCEIGEAMDLPRVKPCIATKEAIMDFCVNSSKIAITDLVNSTSSKQTTKEFCNNVAKMQFQNSNRMKKTFAFLKELLDYEKCVNYCPDVVPLCNFTVSYFQKINTGNTIPNVPLVEQNKPPITLLNVTMPKDSNPAQVAQPSETKSSVPSVSAPNTNKQSSLVNDNGNLPSIPPQKKDEAKENLKNNLISSPKKLEPPQAGTDEVAPPVPGSQSEKIGNPKEGEQGSVNAPPVAEDQPNNDLVDDGVHPPDEPEESEKVVSPNQVKKEPAMPDINEDDYEEKDLQPKVLNKEPPVEEFINANPKVQYQDTFKDAPDSHFFTYFLLVSGLCIFFYVAMYNKKKILALVIEGRKRNVKRRPNSAAYRKLDCNLEEAMASGPSTSSSNTLLY